MHKFFCGRNAFSSLGIYLGEELLGILVTLCLGFKKIPKCFPKRLHYFTFPPAVCEGSSYSTFSPTFCFIAPFSDYSQSSGCEMLPHGFDLHFPTD